MHEVILLSKSHTTSVNGAVEVRTQLEEISRSLGEGCKVLQ
jgi:hypothetical protein